MITPDKHPASSISLAGVGRFCFITTPFAIQKNILHLLKRKNKIISKPKDKFPVTFAHQYFLPIKLHQYTRT
jgi:hypothetical protein